MEANHDLEESVKSYQETLHSYKDKYKTLEGEKTLLQQELNSARQLNTQINETKNETQKSLNTISLQNRTQASKIKDLEVIQKNLKQKIDHLQLKIKDLEEREKLYRETAQIGILVPIEPQRRTNGTSGTGSSIKHLKAVPFKTKKAPKRGNFHSPM